MVVFGSVSITGKTMDVHLGKQGYHWVGETLNIFAWVNMGKLQQSSWWLNQPI